MLQAPVAWDILSQQVELPFAGKESLIQREFLGVV